MGHTGILTITTREDRGGWLLTLTGELDMSTASQLTGMLRTDKPVVVDLRQLTFLDSSGLSALLTVSNVCEGLRLVPGPPEIQRVFEITGTLERFEWSPAT